MLRRLVRTPTVLCYHDASSRRPLPFELLVDHRVFLAAELPGILPTETDFVDALPVHPKIASLALDFIGFERDFLSGLALLSEILESNSATNPELSSSLLAPLRNIKITHQAFLIRLESVVALHTPGFVIEFVGHIVDGSAIFQSHHSYILQILTVENFVNSFCFTCPPSLQLRLKDKLLIHYFKLPFAWQDYAAKVGNVLLELLPPDADPYLQAGLAEFRLTNENLSASVDSIPKLEQISKLFLIEPFPIAISGRRFIRQGRAWKQCRKAITLRELFLFSDIFMYVQPKGGKYMVPASYKLAFLRVLPSSYNDRVSLDIYAPMKSFILQFAEEHERDAWNLAFQEAIVNAKAQKPVPRYKEAPIWIPDISTHNCMICGVSLTFFRRRHHCRNCGKIMCRRCLPGRMILRHISEKHKSKVCLTCMHAIQSQGRRDPLTDERTIDDDDELARAVIVKSVPEASSDDDDEEQVGPEFTSVIEPKKQNS